MKRLARTLALIFIGGLVFSHAQAQDPERARTEGGREVLLFPDGKWKYAEEAKPQPAAPGKYEKSAMAKAVFQPARGSFKFWYDETKWRLTQPTSEEEGRAQFQLIGGDGYAMIFAEGLAIPLKSLKELAIENARRAAPDIKGVKEEMRVVNGRELLVMQMDGTIRGVPFTYYGYYYGGKEGAIQVITYTGQNLLDKYMNEFTSFLNGLEVQ